MRIPATRRPAIVGGGMTSMVDVVFLLIIFFLVSSHLARRDHRVPLVLPTASAQTTSNSAADWLTVHIDADQQVHVGGTIVEPGRVEERLRAHATRSGDAAALRVRADVSVPYRVVGPVLRQAALAGFEQVSFATVSD